MSNYDLDEEERRNRQWDAHTQRYISVGDQVDDLLEAKDIVSVSYEKEEVTNPDHYDKVGFAIQPIEYITKNELDFLEGNVIKYVSRYQHKGGINDLLKARTYIEFLITREREKNGD
jgi:hypothetical protein